MKSDKILTKIHKQYQCELEPLHSPEHGRSDCCTRSHSLWKTDRARGVALLRSVK
jgi:hypothetical protein